MSELSYCSFCGKDNTQVLKLIAGPRVFICNECAVLCCDILGEDVVKETRETKIPATTFPFPETP